MSEIQIQNLPTALTPLGANDVLPVVQSGITRSVSISSGAFALTDKSNVFTSSNTFSTTGASYRLRITSSAGNGKYVVYQTTGLTRWEIGSNSAAESGANNGSDLVINRYDDAGNYLASPLTIERDNGLATLERLSVTNNVGIGTSSPAYQLDVRSATNGIKARVASNSGTVANDAGVLVEVTASPTAGARNAALYIDGNGANVAGSDYLYLMHVGDNQAYIYNQSADNLHLGTGGTTKLLIDGSGNVGIGTASPGVKLDVSGSIRSAGTDGYVTALATTGTAALSAISNARSWRWVTSPSDTGALRLSDETAGVERMRVDFNGNVGIGTTIPTSKLLVSSSSGDAPNGLSGKCVARLQSTQAAAVGVGPSLLFEGQTGNSTANYAFAGIQGFKASATAGDYTGSLAFFTQNAGGASALTEQMRIDASGNVGIGTSSPASYGKFSVLASSGATGFSLATAAGNYVTSTITDSGDVSLVNFSANSTQFTIGTTSATPLRLITGNTERMRVDVNGNALIGYTTSSGPYKLQVNSQIFATSATIATSDGNYKEGITPLDGALELVSALNPVQFSWKEHPVHNFDRAQPTVGFIAQEVQQALADTPYLNSIVKANTCTIEPEELDDEGNVTKPAVTEEFLGIAEGNMIALLTKAIQELKSEFDAYKANHP